MMVLVVVVVCIEIHARAESHGATNFQLLYTRYMVCYADPREFSSKMNYF